MSEISKEELKKEIHDILKDADLSSMSTKKVREELEKKFKCDLNSRKTEIKDIVMDYINSKESNEEDGSASGSEEEEEEEEEPKAKKRASTARKPTPAKKKKKASSDEENSESENDNDDGDSDYNGKPKRGAKKSKAKSDDDASGSGSDDDWKASRKAKKAPAKKAKGKGGAGKEKRATGFTRSYQLSSDLAQVVGAESMPRYEVVKKIWARVKERNLYDPKNKQYAICDDEMLKVFGVKRFRTFSMLKYLKPHFID